MPQVTQHRSVVTSRGIDAKVYAAGRTRAVGAAIPLPSITSPTCSIERSATEHAFARVYCLQLAQARRLRALGSAADGDGVPAHTEMVAALCSVYNTRNAPLQRWLQLLKGSA
jgi:hypothetical protein